MSEVKKTPLAATHEQMGAKMVEFAGWWMPIQYKGLRQEHNAVRKAVGLFDVSHMGEIRVKGPLALETVEWLTTNLAAKLEPGQAQYSLLPNDQGGLIDDVIVYCIEKDSDYLICVNAANKDKDWDWIERHNKGADLTDESDAWGQLAIQGPKAAQVLAKVFPRDVIDIAPFSFRSVQWQGAKCFAARTGYTGEDGFEIFVPAEKTVDLWNALLKAGEPEGIEACGLGARDTLRTEVKYPLYGNEIDDHTNPYSAGLGWVVKPKDKDFLGREIILENKKTLQQKLVGFKMVERGIPRTGYPIYSSAGEEIGRVTSGTQSPITDEAIGIGYIRNDFADIGSDIRVGIRSRQLQAKVVQTPFLNPGGQ
jgi:aminomethyltransferase